MSDSSRLRTLAPELLQAKLDEITQNTRRLVQPERLEISERMIADLFATGIEDLCLGVGQTAPAFCLNDSSTGRSVRSEDLLAVGPVIVKFFRGRWDPYCVTELEMWRDLYSEVRRRGALVVAISPMTERQGSFAVDQHHFPFPLLSDPDCRVAAEFCVAYAVSAELDRYLRSVLVSLPFINSGRNVRSTSAGNAGSLPLPAAFLIDRTGAVRYSEAHADHRVRPEPLDILSQLEA